MEIDASPEQIVLTAGASQALDLVARYFLQPGDPVLVDEPGYYVLFGRLAAMGVRLIGVPRTTDGVDIRLYANAESREDVAEAHALGADGIGLYRTEFLFLQRRELPTEEEQFLAYRDLVLGMAGRVVTIRTLDLGADKADHTGLALRSEPNPALGAAPGPIQ